MAFLNPLITSIAPAVSSGYRWRVTTPGHHFLPWKSFPYSPHLDLFVMAAAPAIFLSCTSSPAAGVKVVLRSQSNRNRDGIDWIAMRWPIAILRCAEFN